MATLETEGYDGFSIAAVAAHSGVHETTLYRRWGNRAALAMDALLEASERLAVPDTGSLRTDMVAYVAELAEYLTTPAGQALDRVLASMSDDAEVAGLRDDYWARRAAMSGQMIDRAVARGDLPPGTDSRFVLEMVVAPIHFRVLLSGEPVSGELAARVVDTVLPGLTGNRAGDDAR